VAPITATGRLESDFKAQYSHGPAESSKFGALRDGCCLAPRAPFKRRARLAGSSNRARDSSKFFARGHQDMLYQRSECDRGEELQQGDNQYDAQK